MSRQITGTDLAAAWAALGEATISAERSLCLRSRCGSIVLDAGGALIGRGHNSPPGDCPISVCRKDALPAGFKSDRTCCLHAEQRAIMDALAHHPDRLSGGRLYFVRLDDELSPKPSGRPYCSICSKLALDVGLAEFVLWQATGFTAYATDEYNQLTFAYDGD
jgi:hypothetical protein